MRIVMSSSTALRVAVVLEWIVGGLALILSLVLEKLLPQPLQAWVLAEAERDAVTPGELMLLVAGVALLGMMLVSSVGLLCLQRWAAWLYLATVVTGTLFVALMGPTVEHGVTGAVDDLASVVSGVVVGLAFFSTALTNARREPAAT
jgi:uncharacterized membrane protein (DUF2068 family)